MEDQPVYITLHDWINSALAAYLEDLADAQQGRNFATHELLTLGAIGGTVMANIMENFFKLAPEDREQLIHTMQTMY